MESAVVYSSGLFSQRQTISDIYWIRACVSSRDSLDLGEKNTVILPPRIELLLNVGLHLIQCVS